MTTYFIILSIVLLISLVFYIVARIRLSKEKLVLTAGRLDVTFLMISPLFAIIGILIRKTLDLDTLAWIFWIIAIVCVALSIMYSITENKDSVWDMIWSAGAKVFILITTVFIIILSMVIFLGYMVFYLVKEHGKTDEEADQDSKNKFALPQYRKFMNAYVGIKSDKKKEKKAKKEKKDK